MEELDRFINYLNEKTCHKFEFLRLKQVFFDIKKNTLEFSFIYPSDKDLTIAEKTEIEQTIKEYVGLNVKYIFEFAKSYIENDLVLSQITKYIAKNHSVMNASLDKKDIIVDCDSQTITFNLESRLYDYFNKNNISKSLFEFLSHNFCANFEIRAADKGKVEVKNDLLEGRLYDIKTKSELDSIMNASRDRFVVENKEVRVGKEITYNPRRIKTINRVYDDCVIAGTINFITEKMYKSKRTEINKDGVEEQIEKPFFNFQVKDDSGMMRGVLFPSKANYHKMGLIANGQTVIVQGKISKYNGNFEITAKNISVCSIPKASAVEKIADENQIVSYRYIKPRPFSLKRQANFFEEKHYSNEVLNNSFVVFDFETTGIDFASEEIIEIGALKVVGGEFSEVFTTLVKPKKSIPEEATKVNKITNEMVQNCYSIGQVLPDFYLFCKGCQMVGYNSVGFDCNFLNKAAKEIGINFDNTQIDVYQLAKEKLNGLRNYKLGTVAKYLEVPLIDAHRALNDVIATAEVFLKLY